AEKNATADKKRKASIEIRNKADTLIYSTEKALKEHGEKLAENNKSSIEQAVTDLKNALEEGNDDNIAQKTEALAAGSMQLGEALYTGAGDAGMAGGMAGGAHNNTGNEGGENVVNGQFKDVSEK